jgi:galactokinase
MVAAPSLHSRLISGFAGAFGGKPDLVARAPGRVNLIGEHTDYNDGFALPIAIGVETRIALCQRADAKLRICALDFDGARDEVSLDAPLDHAHQDAWCKYVRGVVAVLTARGYRLCGAEIAIAGDIPKGAGLSSSASMEIALIRALTAASGERYDVVEAALDAQRAENEFVGVRCGVMDQLASAGGVDGAALLIDCRALTLRSAPMPPDAVVMIVQSGVERGLVDGRYNRRREQCETAARAMGIEALRDADMSRLDDAREALDEATYRRARHVITENARTLAAASALERNDLYAVGRLMAESHDSMRNDFAITVEPSDRLAALMHHAIRGEGGARQTGGGFGGAVIGLMRVDAIDRVREAVLRGYRTPNGQNPDIRIERAMPGADLVAL